MHILFISEYYTPKIMGGGEINLQLLAQALAKKSITVSVLTSHFSDLPTQEKINNVMVYRRLKTGASPNNFFSNIKRSTLFPRSLKKEIFLLVKEIKPEVIHLIGQSLIVVKSIKQLNIPLFATIESYPSLCPKGDRLYHGREECKHICSVQKFIPCQHSSKEIGKMKNKFYLKYNPLFLLYTYWHYKELRNSLKYCFPIAISSYVRELLTIHNYASHILPNILPKHSFLKVEKKEEKTKEKLIILFLGSLIESKGPHILLQAIKGIDCRCELYGEGIMKGKLQLIIQNEKLDAQIHPPVPYNKIADIYTEADVVVFPSLWPEPFGRIAIESAAAGKPIIASNIGGIRETVSAESGILVPSGDVQALHDAIVKILIGEHRPRIDHNTKQEILKQYSEETVTNQLLQIYTKSLSQ